MIIEFKSVDEMAFEIDAKPYPASKAIPDWWKNANSSFQHLNIPTSGMSTFKRCMPILDVLSAGYIIPLHSDIEVVQVNNETKIMWPFPRPVVEKHIPEKVSGIEIPNGYSDVVFKYMVNWTIKTPPGYSCLVTHPFGYNNLPFHSFSGIVDSDRFHADINTPFTLRKNFSGVIPKGTPMMQIIPFKRENWESKVLKGTPSEVEKNYIILMTKLHSGYKKFFRDKKTYL